MSGSGALASFRSALDEVRDLEKPGTGRLVAGRKAAVVRAAGRAAIVLLTGHFERYFYAINEEAAGFVNARAPHGGLLPEELRLLHSRYPLEDIEFISWERRAEHLERFMVSDGWLWTDGGLSGEIDHSRLLAWMKSPAPKHLLRYYRYWGIDDVFSTITRRPTTRSALWLGIQSLVDKRNNIAHGDLAEQATARDVRRYARVATEFCTRADKLLSRRLVTMLGGPAPW